jgi:hypothetical protein
MTRHTPKRRFIFRRPLIHLFDVNHSAVLCLFNDPFIMGEDLFVFCFSV